MKIVARILVVIFLIIVMGHFAINLLFFGRWTQPGMNDFAALARQNQYIVQAICDYRADHGMLPQNLSDLVPGYLSSLPGPMVFFDADSLDIPANAPHTGVYYSFRPGQEGWYVGGDFGNGALPVPKVASTRPSLNGETLITTRVAEYDRRIAADPKRLQNYVEKLDYLYSVNKTGQVLATCQVAARKFPQWWRPKMVTAMLADSNSRPAAEAGLRSWVKANPSFIHWWYLCRYYRENGRDNEALAALENAVKYPLQNIDDDEDWVPAAFAFDAAAYTYQQRQYGLVLEIVRVWASPVGVYNYFDNDIYAFRAAAELELGKFADAKADAQKAVGANAQQAMWAGHLTELREAADRQDQEFVYDPGNLCGDWTLFEAPSQ